MKPLLRNRPKRIPISSSLRFKPRRITDPGPRFAKCTLVGGPLGGSFYTRTGTVMPFTVRGGVYESAITDKGTSFLQWKEAP